MAKSLDSIITAEAEFPPRIVAYGPKGVGKTSLGLEFPNPVFIQTEVGTPGGAKLQSFGAIESFEDVMSAFEALIVQDNPFSTVVIDTLDSLEPLVWREACQRNGWNSIEEPGYGKGYVGADDVWREYLSGVDALTREGFCVLQLAHHDTVLFEDPTSNPYKRYVLRLHKRAQALVTDNADIVLFANFTHQLKTADAGFNKKVSHGESSGERSFFLEHRPGFDAKNRYGMPSNVPYRKGKGYGALSKFFLQPRGVELAEAA